jgi:hypothetical protein
MYNLKMMSADSERNLSEYRFKKFLNFIAPKVVFLGCVCLLLGITGIGLIAMAAA